MNSEHKHNRFLSRHDFNLSLPLPHHMGAGGGGEGAVFWGWILRLECWDSECPTASHKLFWQDLAGSGFG